MKYEFFDLTDPFLFVLSGTSGLNSQHYRDTKQRKHIC